MQDIMNFMTRIDVPSVFFLHYAVSDGIMGDKDVGDRCQYLFLLGSAGERLPRFCVGLCIVIDGKHALNAFSLANTGR